MLNIHQNIKDKLQYFHKMHKIPNIIFNGPSGSGKSTIVNEFISLIYDNNKITINNYVMYVNCAHGKGIKFIRDDLKFFAKTHINSNGGNTFKSIILLNGDKLTMDAQSALRRCIELFCHNTRFFIVVEDKSKLLRPILSRFCELYISEPEINNKSINLYKHNLEKIFKLTDIKSVRLDWLKKELNGKQMKTLNEEMVISLVSKLYEKSYSSLDLIKLLENNCFDLTDEKRYECLIAFSKVKKDFRNEKLLLMFIINFVFLDNVVCLENLTFV